MPRYHEIPPPAHLAGTVECIWVLRQDEPSPILHRVVPDGCADICFSARGGEAGLTVVGSMTRFQDFTVPSGERMAGLRFRPGMWSAQLGIEADRITDAIVLLEDLWGARARGLLQRIAEAKTEGDVAGLLAGVAVPAERRTPVQRAIAWMEERRGLVYLDDVAREAALSVRQFRRLCLQETGLAPKLLARVLRFRHALGRARTEAGEHAALAADCGYTDQSHLIAEFHRFAGRTPASFRRGVRIVLAADRPTSPETR